MRTIILAVAIGMLIFLYSRYVLLAIVLLYILNGLVARVLGIFRRRVEPVEPGEAGIQANQP